ncbi:regulator of PEP synthase PpsR (kinase-PPPase family) [Methylopila capsulata]|uniref:Putative pyruvate, phosphate dikinase regulatory protein n=1 Tax=Methylopila capsulata TaxID=61654 RepID=A0A9W6ITH1_9HYPH|nr:pyruvate, water dikinase regulatory protein [Methylopila capsulata]MBM7851865.1 regulator of PEP synthase PpsR (kinase-PPPase family) [Methylopila capsulata]GLK54930.1 putative pyruvate, phosphate dikinase regulatory protein [Methylopila capsulata]
MSSDRHSFHVHLVSDATGETLVAVARAAASQYAAASSIEHVYPLVRSARQLERVLDEIADEPGIVLYTLVDEDLIGKLESRCRDLGCPCLSVLEPVFTLLRSYLGTEQNKQPGAQHVLNADYFKRIDALNYTMAHDDGQYADDLAAADVVLLGVSRTSKTPTSIYLANRGVKTANIPLIPDLPPPHGLEKLKGPLIVGLVASPERIVAIRHNRVLGLEGAMPGRLQDGAYVDPDLVAAEITASRRFCARHGWPTIDVTRRSIEETAAGVIAMLNEHRAKRLAAVIATT